MVIDDDLHIGNVLEETLTNEGYGVIRAYSGTEAVLLLSQVKPDLVLLDLMLPGLSGEEVLPHIKGIPVIMVDRKILSDKYTAFMGADNYEIGREVGNYLAAKLGGKGNIVELTGLSGSTPAMERHQGFMSAISHYPDIHLLAKADAAWEREPGRIIMDSLLKIYPKIDAVYSHNDRIAPGAFEAAQKQGREKGKEYTQSTEGVKTEEVKYS